MNKVVATFLQLGALLFALGTTACPTGPSQLHENRSKTTPDIAQRDPDGRYSGDGLSYCGPCAASNALFWFGASGYERLLPQGSRPEIQHRMLVCLLASSRYMQTADKKQTSPAALNEGIKRYVEDCGYTIKRLDTLSFKPFEAVNGVLPDIADTLKEGLKPRSVALIHVGWYKYNNKERDEYTRLTGHYVTVIGFGYNRNGTPDDRIVTIHDPWNGQSDDYVRLEPLPTGTLIVEKDRQPLKHRLAGSYNLTGEMCIYEKADVGLLDHVHIIELAEPKVSSSKR